MNSSARGQECSKDQTSRSILPTHAADPRIESPMPRKVSAFKPISTSIRNSKDKSPFGRFVAQELEPLPYPNIKINKPYEPSLTTFMTPDKPQNYAFLSINDRIDFDELTSPLSKRKEFHQYSEKHSDSEDEQDGMEEEESVEDQESSYDTPEKPPATEQAMKTPAKQQTAATHETRYPTRETREESAYRSQSSQLGQAICCNCKKSRCLKLYCDCFRSNQVCHGCNCLNCLNTNDHRQERYSAMLAILEINEQAFKPKILVQKHAKGCNCKKSNCLKKYCECYQAGLKCSELCKCEDCKNAKLREQRDPPKHRHRTIKKEARYDSHTKKLIS